MLRGWFENTSGAPHLEARVSFPRLGVGGLVSFLVDTGADGTVLMPTDSLKFGIDFGALANPTTSRGIGGRAQGYSETAVLSFFDRRYVYSYLLKIEIFAPTSHNRHFPSLLGRDILKQWRCVIDGIRGEVTFTPRKWHVRHKV